MLRVGLIGRLGVADFRVEQSPVDEGRFDGPPIYEGLMFDAALRRSRRMTAVRAGRSFDPTTRGQRRWRQRTAAREE